MSKQQNDGSLMITKAQIKKIKDTYESNKEELAKLEAFIEENGVTDYGLDDVTESFEQGYNNALVYVFGILGIAY